VCLSSTEIRSCKLIETWLYLAAIYSLRYHHKLNTGHTGNTVHTGNTGWKYHGFGK